MGIGLEGLVASLPEAAARMPKIIQALAHAQGKTKGHVCGLARLDQAGQTQQGESLVVDEGGVVQRPAVQPDQAPDQAVRPQEGVGHSG